MRLQDELEVEHARVERVQPVAGGDRVAGYARLARARGDLKRRAVLQGALLQEALREHHRASRAHARVEFELRQHPRELLGTRVPSGTPGRAGAGLEQAHVGGREAAPAQPPPERHGHTGGGQPRPERRGDDQRRARDE
jgi:hypothetical protein